MKIFFYKIIHSLFFITLTLFAWLQLNDPDPIIWTSFYLLCALVPLLELFNKHKHYIYWPVLTCCIITLGIYAEGVYTYYLHSNEEALMQSMNPAKPYIEEAREFLGSLIAVVLISISYWLGFLSTKTHME
ncbi:MAG TPA: transmembrane 220 family protein [Cellvibrio sp.]|nr:transmembrane 220 family protein [Cellvibrio sp.]